LAAASGSYFDVMRRYFLAEARMRGYAVVDLQNVFIAANIQKGARFEWDIDGHWNAAGHGQAAQAVLGSGLFSAVFSDSSGAAPLNRSSH
jgi:oligoribonuclease NrnB/cAMP/cGMP phosphodiesterase (DHH superfamily)